MKEIWILSAKRTPQGKFLGTLAKRSAVELATHAAAAAIEKLEPAWIDSVILGNVLSAGQGMNPARQVAVRLGLPIETPGFTVNMMCASGMQAIMLAAQSIRANEAHCVLCGGAESMSNAPYLIERARAGFKLGDQVLCDSLLRDGLVDPFGNGHMGLTAERIAEENGISRLAQDAYAAMSQQRHAAARSNGAFKDELVPMDGLDHDEHARAGTTPAQLASLKPAFRPDGTVTAGNSSGINDGAAMLVVCDAGFGSRHGLRPLARISAGCSVGCDPARMGLGPVHATRKLCGLIGTDPREFDRVELNEAFAAQTVACTKQLELDLDKVNRDGGAIAMGHPIGASGARIIVHLAHQLARGQGRIGLAALCVGGGMGCAVALNALSEKEIHA
jgi:acetyl-CoA C-acetyltransferase